MTYRDELKNLAEAHRVATSYYSATGEYVEVSEDTLLKTLNALGVNVGFGENAPTEDALRAAIQEHYEAEFTRGLPPCVVAVQGDQHVFSVHVHDGSPAQVTIELESGEIIPAIQVENCTPSREINGVIWGEASFATPTDLPLGWHTLHLVTEGLTSSCQLVITPSRLSTADPLVAHPVTGVMAQIYSVRSRDSWGMGDFHDLGTIAETTAHGAGAQFLLINPLHAGEPFAPIEASPYLPTSRRFINPLYIRIEDIEEVAGLNSEDQAQLEEFATRFKALNTSPDTIDRNPIFDAKLTILHKLFHITRSPEREHAFREYCDREGSGLDAFATWCAERTIASGVMEHDNESADMAEATDFYRWLQWICDQQLGAAQARAKQAGMTIGIMADLAVGVHPGGADASTLAPYMAPSASVGAPPDGYNQYGQDWSQPPWHPVKLAEAGYAPWRDMLRTVLRHSGGIRVDHVLGLFRLWWIPRMQNPTTGTYVQYDYNALIGILVLEAERAGAVVIGEDLGTFEPWVQDVLAARGIMGTSVLWFEGSPHGGPRHQGEYRQLSLTSVTTHDLPPTAGMLQGEHIALRERLGLFTRDVAEEDAGDLHWQNEILQRIADTGSFHNTSIEGRHFHGAPRHERGDALDLIAGMHRFVAGTPSALACTSLVDMVGDIRAQNQPGTSNDQYPNWCIPLCDIHGKPVLLEDLEQHPAFQKIAEAGRR
ncbi:4-alpha-glucanotransferase [Corynebacterium freiburgense]|uniref:4-alpha-glucanotransferase n=1 Tax=Corynebacterium freiburgense TaxID=556548 RepID=UPI0004265622|nr:4-alpha-glucanotransferase [Corynebacterium freiburgense]